MPTFTKIIATIGPASQDPDTLRKLQQAGMNAARINLSHGDRQSQADYIHRLRQLDNNLAIILDTKGPEIRTGRMAADPTGFTSGQTVVLTGSAIEGTGDTIPIVYPHVDLAVKAILTPTESGFTARNVSRFRPKCPIFASTKDHMVLQHLQLVWGVLPLFDSDAHIDRNHYEMAYRLVEQCHDAGLLSMNDRIIITSGSRLMTRRGTNLLEIYNVSDIIDNNVV